jgi:hypothetical protein
MKKKNGVVAGIAQKNGGKDGPVGYGHADDGGEVSPRFAQPSFLNLTPSLPPSTTYSYHHIFYHFVSLLSALFTLHVYMSMASWLTLVFSLIIQIRVRRVGVMDSCSAAMAARAAIISNVSTLR